MENRKESEKKLKVLIIDDSNSQRLLLQTFLKNFDLIEAESGLEGLKRLYEETFDLIICDFEMPEMSGLDFAKELVKQGIDSGVPFIMCSGNPPEEKSLAELQDIIPNSFWVEKSSKALNLRHLIDEILANS